MKKYLIFLAWIFIICSLSMTFAVTKISANPSLLTIILDGRKMSFPDTQPYVNEDNRTMVPVRFISEALGCEVKWEEANQMVIIMKGQKRILLQVDQNWAIVNDIKKDVREEFDTKVVLREDRAMVPLRFVSEALGEEVTWDEQNNTVILKSDSKSNNKINKKFIK